MQRDEVAAGKEVLQRNVGRPAFGRPGGIGVQVVGEDLHVEAAGPSGYRLADAPGADQTQRASPEVHAQVALPVPFP